MGQTLDSITGAHLDRISWILLALWQSGMQKQGVETWVQCIVKVHCIARMHLGGQSTFFKYYKECYGRSMCIQNVCVCVFLRYIKDRGWNY